MATAHGVEANTQPSNKKHSISKLAAHGDTVARYSALRATKGRPRQVKAVTTATTRPAPCLHPNCLPAGRSAALSFCAGRVGLFLQDRLVCEFVEDNWFTEVTSPWVELSEAGDDVLTDIVRCASARAVGQPPSLRCPDKVMGDNHETIVKRRCARPQAVFPDSPLAVSRAVGAVSAKLPCSPRGETPTVIPCCRHNILRRRMLTPCDICGGVKRCFE